MDNTVSAKFLSPTSDTGMDRESCLPPEHRGLECHEVAEMVIKTLYRGGNLKNMQLAHLTAVAACNRPQSEPSFTREECVEWLLRIWDEVPWNEEREVS